MQGPGGEGRKPQRRRSTETPVGDQHPTDLVEALVSHLKRERNIIEGDAGTTQQLGSIQRQ